MAPIKSLSYLCCLIYLLLNSVQAKVTDLKSSLTFVIDDTASMGDDIEAVKVGANAIFDTVLNSNASQIEDFVLVTFNDPCGDASHYLPKQHRITTKDRDDFKRALASIYIGESNCDCPELSIGGIELGLQKSRPGSLLYVFTDAAAKDPEKHEDVKRLAQQKGIQVVFVLTGDCVYLNSLGYGLGNSEVFDDIARETNGQVFNLYKNEINEILKYIQTQINSRKEPIKSEDFPPGTHRFDFEVDSKMKELVISVSGDNPNLIITGPDSSKPPIEEVARGSTFVALKVTEVKPGTYTADVTSTSKNSVKVTAETSVHFQHGFSTFMPTYIADTVTRPIPGVPSYLSVKLQTDGAEDVVLDKVQIMDLDQKILEERNLELVDRKKQFYVSDKTVDPPNKMFRTAIIGHDLKTKSIITRISLTPIDTQKPVAATTKSPTVTLVGDTMIQADYNETLVLKCKISGYPKPKVVWQRSDGAYLDSTLSLVEMPYDYLSTITIPRVISNDTYYCIARNDYGGDSQKVQVETIRPFYYKLVKRPQGSIRDVNKRATFECEVEALPPAELNWYKNGKLLEENDNVRISSNRSVLAIERMLPQNEGKYYCEAIHEGVKHLYHFDVYISGTEAPVIDKTIKEIRVTYGSDVKIPCKIIHGIPEPTRHWSFEDDNGEEHPLRSKEEHISLSEVTSNMRYRCDARNGVGNDDYHIIYVIINVPPTFVEGDTDILESVGNRVYMDCDVEGEPTPTVKWYLNGTELIIDGRYIRNYDGDDFSFEFEATEGDSGNYTCVATNDFGTASKSVQLHIIRPATITPPDESMLVMKVGDYLELTCQVQGNPMPGVEWVLRSFRDPKTTLKTFRPNGRANKLILNRIQINDRGIYTCIASNVGGSSNITYEVDVYAPPNIENVHPEKTFTAVIDDLMLRVPCKATGNPKPEINWLKDGLDVPAGTEWYDIEEDGTLIIKNVDKDSAGSYVCQARNQLGSDNESYEVEVRPYPTYRLPSKTVKVQRGNSTTLICDIPHTKTDRVRWFKHGRLVSKKQEYQIVSAELSDTGIYTCRVSNFAKARTGSLQVNVGYEPRFTTDEDEIIEFDERVAAVMDCSAEGIPKPEVTWWHGGKQIAFSDMIYVLYNMNVKNKGQYYCLVRNEFGHIQRKFDIVSKDCWLDVQLDLKGNQPLILSPKESWLTFETIQGQLTIPAGKFVLLRCPTGFKNLRTSDAYATCQKQAFTIDGRSYKFSELECNDEIKPIPRKTRKQCLKNNPYSKLIKIGYKVGSEFFGVYAVCLDRRTRTPLYTKHGIHNSLANVEPIGANEFFLKNVTEMYDCERQINALSSVLKTSFHRDDKCCFAKSQLVNARDVPPGLPQKTTYTALNLVPQWSTCNNQNWKSVENRVRTLTKYTNDELLVWTGATHQLQISGHNISIIDRNSGGQRVPKYLWKVVQDPSTKASLAIIQLNIPDITLAEAYRHQPCRDICNEITWMKSNTWRDVKKGFTFCCSIREFERVFGYEDDIFDSGYGKVLYDKSFT